MVKHKILAVFQWLFALFFSSIMVGALMNSGIPVPEGETGFYLIVWYVGLGSGFLMAALAIYVLIKLGIKNWKK